MDRLRITGILETSNDLRVEEVHVDECERFTAPASRSRAACSAALRFSASKVFASFKRRSSRMCAGSGAR